MSNEFDELFGGKKKKTPTLRTPTPTVSTPVPTVREPIPTVREPIPTTPRITRRKKQDVDITKLTKSITDLTQLVLKSNEKLTEQQAELKDLRPLSDKTWNEVNRLKWINHMTRPDKKGFKKVEMENHFSSKTVGWAEIDSVVEEYKKMKIIRTSANGWMRLTPKGREHYRNLLEAKE
ncbi:MAG: hypothetical protein KAQ85_08600 [Thermodesulfovibrionia bacterium]|nr:hypothetical protein [Thermodesulfovibrionia bacterium]